MKLSAEEQSEVAQCFCDTLITCLLLGVGIKDAARLACAEFMKGGQFVRLDRPKNRRLSNSQWRPLRDWVLERDGYVCTYCGDDSEVLCADHVVPLSRNGSNEEDNLVCCCVPCNTSKGAKLISEWRGRYQ